MKLYLVFVLLIILPAFGNGQSDPFYFQEIIPNPDSLENVLFKTSDEFTKLNIYRELGFAYYENKRDSALFYFEKELLLAKKLNRKLWEADACNSIGFISYTQGNYPRALQFLLQAKKICEVPENESNSWPANMHYVITPKTARLEILSRCMNHLASLYGYTGNFKDYADLELFYFGYARDIANSLNDKFLLAIINMNTARHYYFADAWDSALYFGNKALVYMEQAPYTRYKGSAFATIGNSYARKKKYDLAKINFYQSIAASSKIRNLRSLADGYLAMSNLYRELGETDSSIYFGKKALENYEATSIPSGIADTYNSVSKTYRLVNNIDSAFRYLGLAMKAREDLSAEDKVKQFQNLNFDERIRTQQLEEEKNQLQNRIRMYALLAGIAVFMLIAFILLRNIQTRKKANILLQEQKDGLQQALAELKSTQALLIQSEKMASLGELTAGIAHEIQNPLNFVNNFSELSQELLTEMDVEADKGNIEEVKVISADIKQNLEKINHHGRRADSIVKGMLQHSQKGSGLKEPTDINALAEEYLRLSYHGLRARDNTMNASMVTDLDESIGKIDLVQQDISRVLLNLFNNAFYAAAERYKTAGENFKPIVTLTTRKNKDHIEITVKDNGSGIPTSIKDKIFQPFFTTKPAGQGTGLGLSLSYDIIKAHQGSIEVCSEKGNGTEFLIKLPVKS